MTPLATDRARATALAVLAIALLTAMIALTAVTGVSQEAFEAVGPDYGARIAAAAPALRVIVGLDTGFLIVYTLFFVLFARAQGVAEQPLVRLGVRMMIAVAVLDMIEDHHLLALARVAIGGGAIDELSIRAQHVLSQTKFSLSYLGLAMIALGLPRTTPRERAFAWLLGAPLPILGVVQWAAPALEVALDVGRWAGFVSGFAGAILVLRAAAAAARPAAAAAATGARG